MAKFPTFPTLYDDALQLNITNLKRDGFLRPNKKATGTTVWSVNGKETGSISIGVNTTSNGGFIVLSYNYKDQPRQYKVMLITIPSNLGKGLIWYFVCPKTGKRCRKLYSIGGYFYHREAFSGAMYESQKRSKYQRYLDNTFGDYIDIDKLYKKLYVPYFKTHYKGKPTKKYKKLIQRIERAKNTNEADFFRELYRTGK